MHDLKLERFVNEPGDGPMKTFTLRGIKGQPALPARRAAAHARGHGRFFNLVLGTKLTKDEKSDLVAFMRQL
ncbi:MAG: hypothetical protein ACYC5S_03120 [Thiobacillus sp.]